MTNDPTLSICVPVYNEAENLPLLHEAIVKVCDDPSHKIDFELLLVDDGSKDDSWNTIQSGVRREAQALSRRASFHPDLAENGRLHGHRNPRYQQPAPARRKQIRRLESPFQKLPRSARDPLDEEPYSWISN